MFNAIPVRNISSPAISPHFRTLSADHLSSPNGLLPSCAPADNAAVSSRTVTKILLSGLIASSFKC
ncbi:MAG TPA: hypothetical protein DIS74_06525 [Bacteroidales bacterium]|nr:hypothetical protein [Bacteroidales bacterium]